MRFIGLVKGLVIVLGLLVISINTNATPISSENGKLVDYVYMGQFNKIVANTVLKKMPPLDILQAKYNLNLYKIAYETPAPDGRPTIASGLVAMPVAPGKPVGIVSYHHGTRFERDDVPSRNNEKNYIYLATFASSAGYMLVMPDYLGLGDNDLIMHPYVQADTLASSSVNMLIAAKELTKILNYQTNAKLYLGGYSEGGFTTLVLFEMLGTDYPDIPVTAAAPGSAPYDWSETMHFITFEPGPRATAYLAFFFYSMQIYQNYWTNLEEIFVKPYDTLVPELLDGHHSVPDILKALPANPLEIVQPEFINSILTGTDKNSANLMKNFNHYDFTPTAPFLMVGTKGDHDVPFHGAELVYEIFKQKSDLVFIKSVSNTLDHVQALPFVLKEELEFFKKYEG